MNQDIDLAEIANRLISYGRPGFVRPPGQQRPRFAEGISICAPTARDYYTAVSELHQANKRIASTYSIKTFDKRLLAFIAPFVLNSETVEKKVVLAFLRELAERPLIDQYVYRPIHHITKKPDGGPVTLGCFTVYNTAKDAVALDEALAGKLDQVLLEHSEHFLVRTRVKARDDLLALELADALLENFENALRFMIGPESQFDARIFETRAFGENRAIVWNGVSGFSSRESQKEPMDLDVDDEYFVAAEPGFDRIWAHLGASSNSELMGKILRAVDWIGQSIAEKVRANAFMKAAIALEALFTPKKGNFAPSIVFQITENVVLLLGTDEQTRVETDREFKRLYGIRSDITHSGDTDVAQQDVFLMQHMARQVVITLLTNPTVKHCTKSEDLNNILRSLKYSCPPLHAE